MASTPNAYSTSEITRSGTLISELNIVVPRTLFDFFKKYNFTPYMLLTQLSGGSLKIKSTEAENKQFYHYEEFGRDMGFVTANANFTSSGAGTATTVTLTSGSNSASGTRSLPDVGGIFFNARTGVESRVTAVNKATPSAHTMTLLPVVAATDAAGLAGDELQFRGYKYVGEASDYTTTIVKNIAKYTNYCTQHRKDSKMSDLSLGERIDFPYNGQNYYYYKNMDDFNNAFLQEAELLLLDSNLTDNLGYTESGTMGLKQWILANGINKTYASFNVQSTFADIERSLDAEGGPMSYDWLQDTNQNIDVQLALGNEFTNGAIVYKDDDLRRGFKTFTPMFRQFSWTRYTPLSDKRFYGTANATVNDNYGIGIPTGKRDLTGDMSKNDMPQLIKRYQEIKGQKVHTWETGALSPNGKTTKMEDVLSQIEYPGLTLQGSNQFFILKKG